MDPFEKLPPEIREVVLAQAATLADALAMTYASPVLLQQRRHSQAIILRARYPEFCDPSLLNDSMALLLFPKRTRRQYEYEGSLWGRITKFADDLVRKATSSHLRAAYINLPEWSHPSLHPHFCPPRAHRSTLDSLSSAEKKRIFKAFLRFDILSRLFQLQNNHYRTLQECNRRTLDHYEGKGSAAWEVEGIMCVAEYMRTMYSAIAIRILLVQPQNQRTTEVWADGVIAEFLTREATVPLVDIPNNRFKFSSLSFPRRRGRFSSPSWTWAYAFDGFADFLALKGLGELEKVLESGGDYADALFASSEAEKDDTAMKWDLQKRPLYEHVLDESGPRVWKRLNTSRLREELVSSIEEEHQVLIDIYRQRAWAFFDADVYPDTCVFPIVRDIRRVEEGWDISPHPWHPYASHLGSGFGGNVNEAVEAKAAFEDADQWVSPTAAYLKTKAVK
ncbi:hypothetical protein PT974_00420 [Cladobotryum mycophilum]|uniref:Uncharacterized protein n=1 Tax=Cladobotryum mycophilum TaxID=491253 RepID=A0ABR0T0U8_9HYPO